MPTQLEKYTLKMPVLGKISSLPDTALPPNALHDIHNFTYDSRKVLGLMPGWKKFIAASLNSKPIKLIDQFFKNDGSSFFLITDTANTYLFNTITKAFTSVGGTTFTGDYTNNFTADIWPQAGSELYLIVNGVDPVQKYDGTNPLTALGGLTDAEPGGITIETAKIVKTFDDFVLLMHTTEDGDVLPYRIRWNKKGYPEVWKNDATFLGEAGFTDLIETTDWIVAAERLNFYMVIYKERSVYLMEYVGSPTVMRVTRFIDGVGLLGPSCIASMGDSHVIVGNDNMYQLTTSSFNPIGDEIKDEFFGLLNPSGHEQIKILVVEETNEIIFAFPSVASDTADTCYVYNYAMKNWTGPHDRNSTAFGYYQSLIDITWADLVGTWTVQTGYWDERKFTSNMPINLMGDYAGYIYQLYDGITADGVNIDGYVEYGLSDLNKPEIIKRLQKMWVSIDGTVSGNVTMYIGYTDNTDANISWYGPVTVSVTAANKLEFDVDITATYFKLKFVTDNGNPFNILGVTAGFIIRQGTR